MKRVFAFIGFTIAITLFVLNIIDFSLVALILSIAVVLFVASLLIEKTRHARAIPTVLGSIAFACLIFILVNTSAAIPAKSLDNKRAVTTLQIIDIPEYDVNADCYTYTARAVKINLSGAPQNIKIKFKSYDKINADYYDIITADLDYYSFCSNAFDSYGDYGNGIFIRAKLKDIYEIEESTSKPLNYHFLKIREDIFKLLNSSLKGDSAGISIALLTGNKSYLSDRAIDGFRICGASHYLAVSGFHISLICLGLYYILRLIGVPKVLNSVITLSTVLAYCGIADFSKSSIRAAIMMSVMLLASLFKTKSDSLNSLGIAVFLICLNPFAVSDAGAVLTACAMLGIIAIHNPVMRELHYDNKISKKLDSFFVLSICVLLAVTPPIFLFFGNMSIGGVFVNFILEPVIIVILVLVLCLCAFSFFSPVVSVLSYLIKAFSSLLFKIIDFICTHFSKMYGSIDGEIFGLSLCAVFLILAVILLIKKKIPVRQGLAITLAVLVIGFSLSQYQQASLANVYIDNKSVIVVDRDCAVVVSSDKINRYKSDMLTRNKNTLYVDCTDNIDEFLNDDIRISANEGDITVLVRDKVIEINSDCVIINNYSISRQSRQNVRVSFSNGSQLIVRRDNDG